MTSSSTEIFIMLIILILPFLYESCKAFRYYLKFFLYYGIIMLNSIIVIPIMIWHPRDVRNLVLASSMCNHISRLLGLNWELKGREYLDKDEACIIVANHQSSLDILGMFELWPVMQKCTVVAKKELFYAWPFGIAAWLCGLIFIDRLNSESAKTTINCSIEQLKTDKVKLWIFPEGTRKNTGEIHSFKKGAFYTAINSELPILPIVFTEFYFLDNYQKRLDTGRIVITVLPPISTKGLNQADVPALAESTRQLMVDAFNTSSQKLKEELLL